MVCQLHERETSLCVQENLLFSLAKKWTILERLIRLIQIDVSTVTNRKNLALLNAITLVHPNLGQIVPALVFLRLYINGLHFIVQRGEQKQQMCFYVSTQYTPLLLNV